MKNENAKVLCKEFDSVRDQLNILRRKSFRSMFALLCRPRAPTELLAVILDLVQLTFRVVIFDVSIADEAALCCCQHNKYDTGNCRT